MRDFTGFRFGLIHSEDLHLLVVSSSDRYVKNILPSSQDYTTQVPGGDGSYYFGQTFSTQEFSVNVVFTDLSEDDWRKISKVFSTDKPQDLVFDELPYKTYKAKVKSKFVLLMDRLRKEFTKVREQLILFVIHHLLIVLINILCGQPTIISVLSLKLLLHIVLKIILIKEIKSQSYCRE